MLYHVVGIGVIYTCKGIIIKTIYNISEIVVTKVVENVVIRTGKYITSYFIPVKKIKNDDENSPKSIEMIEH